MDPYLEDPHDWPDVHDTSANSIRDSLNRTLPDGFVAQVESRKEQFVELTGGSNRPVLVPDVSVEPVGRQSGLPDQGGGTAVAVAVEVEGRVDESAFQKVEVVFEEIELASVFIMDVRR